MLDAGAECGLLRIRREAMFAGGRAGLNRLPGFVAHVDLAFRVLADQDDGKAVLHAGLTKAADGFGNADT